MGMLDRFVAGRVEKALQERESERARIQKAEEQMLEVSDRRAQEKANELFETWKEELSKAEADEKKKKQPVGDTEPKSYMFDPFQLMETLGYKERIMSMSYDTLRLISERNPIVAAIINTRIHQVTAFSRPPRSKYDIGFDMVLRDDDAKPSNDDIKRMLALSDMLESTGIPDIIEEEERDSFETFLSKEVRDTLTYDQMCFEMVPGRNSKPVCFYAVDASTMRFATTPRILRSTLGYGTETMQEAWKREMDQVSKQATQRSDSAGKDRTPKPEDVRYVQVLSSKVMNTYSEQEMAFGIRNPRTFIGQNSYGVSELEILVSTITSHLWAEEYNKRFFSTGSSPKGIIHFEGSNIDQSQLQAFRRQWHAQVAGVWNAWKTPVIGSPGKLNYTNLQMTNRQMEFSQWIEYLIKLICAVFLIDPSEINFDLKGTSGQQPPMFESSSEQKLKFSRDRGLRPLLRFLEAEINKNIITQIDPRYEFQWVGIDQKTEKDIQELRIKELESFKMVDEIRHEYDMDDIGKDLGGDLIMNSSYIQWRTQKDQQAQMAQQQQMGGGAPGGGDEGGGPDYGEESNDYEPGEEPEPEEKPSMEDLDTHVKNVGRMKQSKTQFGRGEGDMGELDDLIGGLKKMIDAEGNEDRSERLEKSIKEHKFHRAVRGYRRGLKWN